MVASFLEELDMLTDGGRLNLGQGLLGRGGVLSLTTQDVRAGAHALALELLAEPDPAHWGGVAERYNRSYDRGKPRRPNRLQRLYQEWSGDLGFLGLLEACRTHPRLWEAVREALPMLHDDDDDRQVMGLALEVHDLADWAPWLNSYRQEARTNSSRSGRLLEMLPLLPYPRLEQKLAWLTEEVHQCGGREAHLLAARQDPLAPGRLEMPAALRELTLRLLGENPGEANPSWLAAQRGYLWPQEDLQRLDQALLPHDPVHRIVYGARPGRPWLAQLLDELKSGG